MLSQTALTGSMQYFKSTKMNVIPYKTSLSAMSLPNSQNMFGKQENSIKKAFSRNLVIVFFLTQLQTQIVSNQRLKLLPFKLSDEWTMNRNQIFTPAEMRT